MKAFLEKYYWYLLCLLLAFAFLTRIYQVGNIKGYIFDEVYHAVTAKLIARNDPAAYEWWNPAPEPNTAVEWLHPPLAKYTQAAGILLFGENSFGWRISSVVFGTLVIGLLALLADELFKDKRISLLAALLASFDGLLLVQSRIAMNDIHVTFFILLTFYLYAKYRHHITQREIQEQSQTEEARTYRLFKKSYQNSGLFLLFLTGLSGGLAMATKWSGVFAVGTVIFFEGLSLLERLKLYVIAYYERKHAPLLVKKTTAIPTISSTLAEQKNHSLPRTIAMTILISVSKIAVYLMILPVIIYVLSYVHMFVQGKSLVCEEDFVSQGWCYCEQTNSWWVEGLKKLAPQRSAQWEALEARGGCKRLVSHFTELHKQIWWYQTTLKATHAYQSRPIQWFLDIRPVWMYVVYSNDYISNIYALGNPILFWAGDVAVFITIFAILISFFRRNRSLELVLKHNKTLTQQRFIPKLNPLLFTLVAYLFLWTPWQLSPRIMFFYHYTPAVPMLCILLSYWIVKAQNLNEVTPLAGYEVKTGRVIFWTVLFLIAFAFVIFYPDWTGIPVPTWFAQRIYYFIPTWR